MRVRHVGVALTAVSVALLILSKVFIYPDCFSFDSHDDANHAFPGLQIARAALADGELPTINPYNNFGAPLLGDGLTYPFAIQAVTYAFLDGPVAMTVNRFLIAILTVVAGYLFFRIYLSPLAAILCATLAFFNPVAFWYPVHQYQMATPCFFLAIYLLHRLHLRRSPAVATAFVVLLCLTASSVSINHVVMMVPFLLTWTLCRNGFRLDRYAATPVVGLAAAALFSYPQTAEFARAFATSARAGEGVYDAILTTPRELFLGLVLPPGDWIAYNYGAQLQVTTYLSTGVLLAIGCGAVLIRRKIAWKQTTLFLCGIVPTVIAIALYVSPRLRFALPLVRSVDITRVLWFSVPFCYVYAGYLFGYMRHTRLPRSIPIVLVIGSLSVLAAIQTMPETASVSPLHSVILLLVAGSGVATLVSGRAGALAPGAAAGLFMLALILTPAPVIVRVLGFGITGCGGTQYSAHVEQARFTPASLAPLMEKSHRLAAEIHTHLGHDLRAAREGLLGSGARGIVVDRAFGQLLEERKLVTVDQVPYGYFFSRPWQTDALARLGIRYLVVNGERDDELERAGWGRLGTSQGIALYESPLRPTPVYLEDRAGSATFLRDYEVIAGGYRVTIPESRPAESTLILSLIARPGYEATIDGTPAALGARDGFLTLLVPPGSRVVEVRHRPYTWVQVLGGAVLALMMGAVFARVAFNRRSV